MNKHIDLKSVKSDKKLLKFLTATKREFNVFFNFHATDPLLFLVAGRQELDLIMGRKTENWFVGVTKNNCIYILDKKNFAKESNHQTKDFWQTLKHEYSHIYYAQIAKSHFPYWLNEGLACYLSGKKLILKKDFQDKLLNVFSYFDHSDSDIYMVGHFLVENLIKKFGKNKFIKLIKCLNCKSEMNCRQFNKRFYKIYGFQFNKKIIRLIK